MSDTLQDKTFIVTGGNGIGRATALELRSLGTTVVVNDPGSNTGVGENKEPTDDLAKSFENEIAVGIDHGTSGGAF